MIRGAIFDLDGTLLDSNPYWGKAPGAYLASLGKQAAPDLGDIVFSMTVPEATAYMKREYSLAETPEEIAAGINTMMERFYRFEIPIKDEVPALLRMLRDRGIPCVIASVTPRRLVEAALQRYDLLSYFKAVITTADVGIGKHAPDVYFRAADCLGSRAEETLVFEDAKHALKTAKNAGFITIGVRDAAMEGQEEEVLSFSDIYMTDFSERNKLLSILNK